jgi:hypothetical protein
MRKGLIKWKVPYLAITFEIERAWIEMPDSIKASELFSFRPYKIEYCEQVRQRKLESSQLRFFSDEIKRNGLLDIGKMSRNRIRGTGRLCIQAEAVVRQYSTQFARANHVPTSSPKCLYNCYRNTQIIAVDLWLSISFDFRGI